MALSLPRRVPEGRSGALDVAADLGGVGYSLDGDVEGRFTQIHGLVRLRSGASRIQLRVNNVPGFTIGRRLEFLVA